MHEATTQREALAEDARAAARNLTSIEHLAEQGNPAARANLAEAQSAVSEAWHEAGVAAAQEIAFLRRSGAPSYAIEAMEESIRATSQHPAFVAGMAEAEAEAEAAARADRASQVAEDVARTLADEGPVAAAAQLNALTADATPEDALAILEASSSSVDAIVQQLQEIARPADGDQFDPLSGNGGLGITFDRAMADLAAATSRAALAPGGGEVLERVAGLVADAIVDGGIGRFDEALGSTILGGNLFDPASGAGASSSVFAVEVARQLAAAGETGKADDILQNVAAATDKLNQSISHLTDAVNQHNAELGRLLQDWGGLMNEDEQAAAIEAFKASHPEYAQLDALAGQALETVNALNTLPPELASLDHADDLSKRVDQFVERMPDALALSENGQEALAKLLDASGDGETPTLLDRVAGVAATMDNGSEFLADFAARLVSTTIGTALAAGELGDSDAIADALAALERQASIFGLNPDQMGELVDSLDAAVNADTPQAAEEALRVLDRSLQALEGGEGPFSAEFGVGEVFRTAGMILSAIGTGVSGADLDDLENVLSGFKAAANAGSVTVTLVSKLLQNPALRSGTAATFFKTAGTAATVLQAGISTYQAARAFEEGDEAKGALLLAKTAGSIAILAGSTGPGIVVVGVATVALMQLDRVRASNEFEDSHTEAFLSGAGFSPELTNHLRNADDEGRMVGPVFHALAEHLGVEPREFFQALQDLTPGQLLGLVEAAHGVDPTGVDADGRPTFAETAGNESMVAEGSGLFRDPLSLDGITLYLQREGIHLPGVFERPES